MNILQHLHDHFVPNARNMYKPHALAHRSLSLYAALLFSVKLLGIFSLDILPENQAFSSAVTAPNVLQLTNISRQSYGLDPLLENSLLDRAAQAKAEDMFANQYFAHNSPQGKTPWDFIKASGYNYLIAGENLAINFYSAEGVEQAWMNSPEHKANILNKDFEDIGIGIAQGQFQNADAIIVVQMFGSAINQPIATKDSYTVPKPQASQQPSKVISVPKQTQLALAAPSIENPGFVLTNKKQITLAGTAKGADVVYIFDNNQPMDQFKVTDNKFSANITLAEGQNTITAVSFDKVQRASEPSAPLTLKLQSVAPQIISSKVEQGQQDGNFVYKVEVQMQGDPVKILATLGTENIMLQPTAEKNIWEGTFAGASQLQGNLSVAAYDLAGNSTLARVASFASAVQDNYAFNTSAQQLHASVLGHSIDMSILNQFYIWFVLSILILLGLAIGIKRHVQHLDMIAHASGLVMLALIFWLV